MTHHLSNLFPLGQLVITPGALDGLHPADVYESMLRHTRGDWGECCAEDAAENQMSLREGFRLVSIYHDRNGVKFYIITEADRSSTCILLPDEY